MLCAEGPGPDRKSGEGGGDAGVGHAVDIHGEVPDQGWDSCITFYKLWKKK